MFINAILDQRALRTAYARGSGLPTSEPVAEAEKHDVAVAVVI